MSRKFIIDNKFLNILFKKNILGNIVVAGSSASFRVTSLKDITDVIIPHFDKYPLVTQKKADYLLFKQAIMLIVEKKHLTEEGYRNW